MTCSPDPLRWPLLALRSGDELSTGRRNPSVAAAFGRAVRRPRRRPNVRAGCRRQRLEHRRPHLRVARTTPFRPQSGGDHTGPQLVVKCKLRHRPRRHERRRLGRARLCLKPLWRNGLGASAPPDRMRRAVGRRERQGQGAQCAEAGVATGTCRREDAERGGEVDPLAEDGRRRKGLRRVGPVRPRRSRRCGRSGGPRAQDLRIVFSARAARRRSRRGERGGLDPARPRAHRTDPLDQEDGRGRGLFEVRHGGRRR